MRPYKHNWFLIILMLFIGLCIQCTKSPNAKQPETPVVNKTFANPLIQGSDPWVYQKGDTYYYLQTMGNKITIWKTKAMSKLSTATATDVFMPVAGANNSQNIWAPELHYLEGKWYLYYTAGSGPDATQRSWVLENTSDDPTTGTWVSKDQLIAPGIDIWSIDGSILEHDGKRYFLWSGRPDLSKQDQNIYITQMQNPWTLTGTTTILSTPSLNWERNGGPVNEGPQILKNTSATVYLVYSASGCWTDDYALGMLTLKSGGNPMLATDWTKASQPVFTKNTIGRAYGPGHNSFFTSLDATENWILYHANSNSGDGCSSKRNIRMQKFNWNADGSPNFGSPTDITQKINLPSGE